MAITPEIVELVVNVEAAPAASTLQKSGAIISLGGTTLATNADQYCGTLAEVLAILSTAGNYTELTAMATTFFAQGTQAGLYVLELGANATPADLETWITDNPGTMYIFLTPVAWDSTSEEVINILITNGGSGYGTSPPTITISGGGGTGATATANLTNGSVTSVTITAPGSGYSSGVTATISAPTSGTTATGTVVLGNALTAVLQNYDGDTAMTYFTVTTTTANDPGYNGHKCIATVVPSPTAASTEFQAAILFYGILSNDPGLTTPLAPMSYRFAYGVTPWAYKGNSATLTTLLTNYANYIGTGSEGGLSNAIIRNGTLKNGNQISWWYGLDWFQINAHLELAAAIINGSNSNPPLEYDQDGINELLGVVTEVGKNAASFKCILSDSPAAVPFYTYTQANPSDYSAGVYNGLSDTVVGINGFLQIKFVITALQFVPAA